MYAGILERSADIFTEGDEEMRDRQWPYGFVSWRCIMGFHLWEYSALPYKTKADSGGFYNLDKERTCERCGKRQVH